MDLGIAGRGAAVAAASAGLGFGAAKALVDNGVRVAICGRYRARVDDAAARLGPLATPLVADVSDAEGATAFVAAAREVLGEVDILIANAGGPPPGTFDSTPFERYRPALELSLLSTVAMCQAAVGPMRERRWGRVVAITSVSVRQPIPNLILSNTARAGLTGFLKTLAREIAADGVTVNSVQPGVHATDRITSVYGDASKAAVGVPAGVAGDPFDFGEIVAFLCSQQARFVTGAAIPVDGGAYAGLQ
jgi:3-oxoacyl-[acyl-carrier protein] reductase